jgi:zinc protease
MARLLLLLLACVTLVTAQEIKITEHNLANGMKILIHEDHDVPNVALYFFYKIGSRNERPGATGISHYFEHMMFNGAKKYGPKQFDIQMEKAGGSNNAYTSRDVTVYTDWFPRSALDLMFDMEADRIANLSFDPKIVESERGVVYSERRTSVDNNPFGALYEQLNAAAYIAHPYQWPVLGWASDIESWTMDDLKAHYRMGYAPNNCVVVVTGDVSASEILALAKKHFEPIPRQAPPPAVRTKEPEQLGERRVVLSRAAALPIVLVSYHAVNGTHGDMAAFEVLDAILTEGRSSRLYRKLVETQLALNVGAGIQWSLDPGQYIVNMQVRAGVKPEDAEKALYEELDKVAAGGVTQAEVEKARNQLLVAFYSQLRTIAGKANTIGRYEVFRGGWNRLSSAAAEYDRVTPDDVRRVAAKYLTHKNRTVATLIPEQKGASR